MTYNPSATATIGLEFDAYTDGVTALTTPTTCAAWFVDSTVTETISAIYVPHTWAGPSTGYGKLCVDVYNLADTGAGATLTETRYQPNEDDAESNVYNDSWVAVTAGTTYVRIDESAYSDTDYLNFPNSSSVRVAFNTAAMSASLQVASVKFEIRVFGYWGATGSMRVELYNNTTRVSTLGTITPPADSDGTHPGFRTYTVGPFTTNPLTGVAWTATDIINMDTGSNLMVQLQCDEGRGMVAVSWLSMLVTTGADKRVATGTTALQTSLPAGTQTNLPVTLAAAWSKTSGVDYLLVARRIDDPTGSATTLIPQPMWIGTGTNPHVHGKAYTTTLDASGLLATVGSINAEKTYGFWLATASGTTMSVDSQPYFDVTVQACHTSSTLRQGVNGAAATIYKGVQLLVALPSTTPGADLLVKVKKVSDNSQLGGTATITAAEITDGTLLGTLVDATLGTISIYRLNVNLASTATLATATNYYFEYTSSAASTAPWYVVMLDATATHTLTGNETYGGSTDASWISGTTRSAADFVTRISTACTAPSSITVTATSITINGTTVQYSDVDWVDGGVLGATFDYWEVQRSEDSGTTWLTVATVSTEATVTFGDYEALKSIALKYRVRKVRTDGAVSDWTTQSGTTSLAPTPATVFTSNIDATLTVGYVVRGTDASYRFLSADETVFMRLHDRDYQAAFRPLETRGMSWSFEALYQSGASTPGAAAFTALRAIAEDPDVPYICMHTADAERFFGVLQVFEGRRNQSAAVYSAMVTFTETQADSTAVDL